MIHRNVFVFNFLILLISGWVVAASLMAEKTNVVMAVFSCVQTDVCRITMSGKVSDLPIRSKHALFRQKKLDRINFKSGKRGRVLRNPPECHHWSVGVTRCW